MKTGEGGRTFGTISTKEVAAAVKEQLGLEVDKKKMKLDEPIKTLGAKTPQKEVLENVVAEMEEAERMVGEIDEVPAGRINKSAVRGILARVYLKLAGWPVNGGKPMYEKAAYWAKEVNKDKKHQLNPDYKQIFI